MGRRRNVTRQLNAALRDGKLDEAAVILQGLRPYDQAEAVRRLELPRQLEALAAVPAGLAAEIFQELEREETARLLAGLGAEKAALILNEMSSDDAADLLRGPDHRFLHGHGPDGPIDLNRIFDPSRAYDDYSATRRGRG